MFESVRLGKFESLEKVAEGHAIHWAITCGACDSCKFLIICEKDRHFIFPETAACMVKKKEILKEWGK